MNADDMRQWRWELGLSQRYAAAVIGISTSALQKFELASNPQRIPRTVAYACAAIRVNVMPFGATPSDEALIRKTLAEAKEIRNGPPARGLDRPAKEARRRKADEVLE